MQAIASTVLDHIMLYFLYILLLNQILRFKILLAIQHLLNLTLIQKFN
jgi:hypothetical protein